MTSTHFNLKNKLNSFLNNSNIKVHWIYLTLIDLKFFL